MAREHTDEWDKAALELQLLLLDNGAVIRDRIPDKDIWDDLEERLTK
jgi:hypothetical protein